MWDKTFRQTMQSWFLGIRSPPSVSNLDDIDVTDGTFCRVGPIAATQYGDPSPGDVPRSGDFRKLTRVAGLS